MANLLAILAILGPYGLSGSVAGTGCLQLIAAGRWAGRQSIGPLNLTDMRFNGHLGLFLLALAADLLTLARGKNRPKF